VILAYSGQDIRVLHEVHVTRCSLEVACLKSIHHCYIIQLNIVAGGHVVEAQGDEMTR